MGIELKEGEEDISTIVKFLINPSSQIEQILSSQPLKVEFTTSKSQEENISIATPDQKLDFTFGTNFSMTTSTQTSNSQTGTAAPVFSLGDSTSSQALEDSTKDPVGFTFAAGFTFGGTAESLHIDIGKNVYPTNPVFGEISEQSGSILII